MNLFNKAVDKWGTDSVEGVSKVVREVVPYLAKVENGVIREVWARKLAEKVGVDKARVWEEIEKIRFGRKEEKAEVNVKPSEAAGNSYLICRWLDYCFFYR